MNLKSLFTLTAFTSGAAFAAPAPDVLKWISDNYRPTVRAESAGTDLSLFGCWISEVNVFGQDPVTLKERKIDLKIYHAYENDEDAPTVLILPPTGGENILDRGYANSLCNNGIRAVLISGWEHQLETSLDPKMHDNGALRSLTAIRHVLEFLHPQRPNQIGILGTSVGAMSAALALNYEPRLNAGTMIVGAGRFADVIADSDEQGARALREARMKFYGYKDVEEYRSALKASIITEPAQFAGFSGPKKTMIITADRDTTVRTEYQLEFSEQMRPSVHLHLSGNHLEVIKASFFHHCAEITDFFKSALSTRGAAGTVASKTVISGI